MFVCVRSIFFNGPRAAVNFNWLLKNLLLNTCRESGDHGPWNSWDRVPYITTVRDGKASIVPAFNQIHSLKPRTHCQSESGGAR